MTSFQNKYDFIENLIFTEGLQIASVEFSDDFDKMFVHLTSELVFVVPIGLYSRLKHANPDSLQNYKLIAASTGIHWPDLDEDLSLNGFLKDYLKQKIHTEKALVFS